MTAMRRFMSYVSPWQGTAGLFGASVLAVQAKPGPSGKTGVASRRNGDVNASVQLYYM
jgi:hypothetical protein